AIPICSTRCARRRRCPCRCGSNGKALGALFPTGRGRRSSDGWRSPTMSVLVGVFFFIALGVGTPAKVKDFALVDARGKKHTAADWKGKKAVVLLFLGTDCPVSNFYCPEYVRLEKEFSTKGVLFYGIYPDPDVMAADAAQHASDYRLPFPVLLDPTHAVTRQ